MDPKPPEEDETMDQFMEKFRTQKYEKAFNEETWEEEFEKIPMFMKEVPDEIDPEKNPELACLQSMLFDVEEQAQSCKEEGNDYFKEKNYKKAITAYTEGIKKNCKDVELNAVLYTNRAAAQFHLGNYRSSLNDSIAARKQKPDHLKAVIRGNRAAERDARKLKQAEKKKQAEKDSLFLAIKDRGIKLLEKSKKGDEDEDEETSGTVLNDISSSENVPGSQVVLDENGRLHWPVLFFYPEHSQTDFISAFHEDSR
ncbi:hypothetical protein GDO78_022666 [Eleutherodactylus coqui]|uniref:Tetratricopeptide repeat protein 4 n=1 Tax=Eleutherodactylus coqui TaxID=57060 RepID=A0A8J6JU64_ELECQ|nr:hypothetical protein GDO78_022666 [Eleutherodactylus coqui]